MLFVTCGLAVPAHVGTPHTSKFVHGMLSRDASLALLQRNRPIGYARCDLLVRVSSFKSVLHACAALRHANSYSVVQMACDGNITMLVCCNRSRTTQVVSVLSTRHSVRLASVQRALSWHADQQAGVKLKIAPEALDL